MFDLFGKKRKQELFDKAYAEFLSGNYNVTIKNLTQLVNEGSRDHNIYNLRAKANLSLNRPDLAFKDSVKSTNLQPNIEQNNIGYQIRNNIINQLKTGELEVDIYELMYFYTMENVFQLFEEHCRNALISITESKSEFVNFNLTENQKIKLLFIAYNYLYFSLIQTIQRANNFDENFLQDFKKVLANAIKNNLDKAIKEIGKNLKHPFYFLLAEMHFKPYFERSLSYVNQEHLLPYDQWLFWLGQDQLDTLSNYVFKNGHEKSRISSSEEREFVGTFLLNIKESIINKPMLL